MSHEHTAQYQESRGLGRTRSEKILLTPHGKRPEDHGHPGQWCDPIGAAYSQWRGMTNPQALTKALIGKCLEPNTMSFDDLLVSYGRQNTTNVEV
jgi:hypothetical protein